MFSDRLFSGVLSCYYVYTLSGMRFVHSEAGAATGTYWDIKWTVSLTEQ